MRKLINFLIQYSVVILFLFLEIISFTLIVNHNGYQKSVFFSSSNSVIATFYEINSQLTEFFNLKSANEGLASENTQLKNQLVQAQNELQSLKKGLRDTTSFYISPEREISFIQAKVINNSTNKKLNYITLNKGSRDGIVPDMGVINEKGVVGIVARVSERFATVIPVLNPKIQINSKFKKNNYSGPVVWEGPDYRLAQLKDIARHVKFALGDTLVTSGFTHSFPEGIMVGTIEDFNIRESDAYYDIKIKLAVNFRTLSHVKVIRYQHLEEQIMLEDSTIMKN